jgi:hypothetical protein
MTALISCMVLKSEYFQHHASSPSMCFPRLTFSAREPCASFCVHNMLGLLTSENNYRMLSSVDIWPGKTFSIRTRSFTAVLRLLCMGVDAVADGPNPPEFMDTADELFAKMADAPDGSNLTQNMNAMFRVHCTSAQPKQSLVSVLYRDQWYWIDENDATSRCIFAMTRDMYDLQVKNEVGNAPVLTIPVGSGR